MNSNFCKLMKIQRKYYKKLEQILRDLVKNYFKSQSFDTLKIKFCKIGWNGRIWPNRVPVSFCNCSTLQHKIGFLLFVVCPRTWEIWPSHEETALAATKSGCIAPVITPPWSNSRTWLRWTTSVSVGATASAYSAWTSASVTSGPWCKARGLQLGTLQQRRPVQALHSCAFLLNSLDHFYWSSCSFPPG
jgi:hypothetical protein